MPFYRDVFLTFRFSPAAMQIIALKLVCKTVVQLLQLARGEYAEL